MRTLIRSATTNDVCIFGVPMTTSSTTPLPESDELSDTGRLDNASRLRIFSVLAAIVLYTEITPLQYAMVGAALQKMTKSFPAVGANLNWAIIILGLVGASASPLLGKMSDVWGKKRIFLICGLFFIAGSLIDAVTNNWALFLVGRGLQALAVATQFIAWGLIRDLMPRKYIPLALGVTATGLGFSGVIAPVIGGYLVGHFDWHAMFWFLAIFSLVMTPIVVLVVPESKLRVKQRIDPVGALLLSAGAALVLIYLDKGQDWGWGRPTTLAWLIGGLVLLGLFFVLESRVSQPIMNIKLLLHPRVSLVLLIGFFAVFMLSVQPYAMGYMTQTPSAGQLKDVVAQGVVTQAHQMAGVTIPASTVHVAFDPGYTYGSGFTLLQYAVHMGLIVGPVGMIFGPLGGILARRIGARVPAIVALILMAGCAAAYALTSYSWVTYTVIGAVFGIGFGLFYAAVPILMVDAVPQEQQGISVGMLGVTLSMGSAVGLAVMTALLNNSPVKAHIDVAGHSVTQVIPQVFADRGYTVGFWVVTATTVVALVIAIVMRAGRAPASGGAQQQPTV